MTALCLSTLAIACVLTLLDNWAVHRLSTKVFCFLYVVFLLTRACTTLSEPVTLLSTIMTGIMVAILYPLILCLVRLLRLGDLFHLSNQVGQLREEVKKKGIDPTATQRLRDLEARIERTLDELDSMIKEKK